MLAGHNIVSASISLSGNESYFGNGCLSVGVKEFTSVLDDTTELLVSSWQEAWHVSEGNNGDLESITESDESSGFHGSINIQATSQDLWLVGN